MSMDKYQERRRSVKLAAIRKAEGIMRDLGKFTVADIIIKGLSKSTVRAYMQTMLLDGRIIKLRDAYGSTTPALYAYGTELTITADDHDDAPVRQVVTKWPVGGVRRDPLQLAFFGNDRRVA